MLRYFIYCRKSTESEDRQVLSIESQLNELKQLAAKLNLQVAAILSESKSAKSPGRPIFDGMMKRISRGEADGILCWKLDRLARNPIDGAQVIWLLQRSVLKHIQTYDRAYYPEDNVLMMNLEFGMANQFILDLSKNVKRGLRAKLEKGWRPGLAPVGYLNDSSQGKGKGEISRDPDSFTMVKRMWEMMVTGAYTPPKIMEIANIKWGLKTRQGKPLPRSTIYRVFTNPFYCGWFEYPKRSGNWYKGSHEPMVTQGEYDRVQLLLGRKGNPRAKKREFAFRGLIRCGECGGAVTVEEKNQIICPKCKYKFSTNKRNDCPRCKTLIEEMQRPTLLRYVYYHCTKRKRTTCSQRSIELTELETEMSELFAQIQISVGFKDWVIRGLKEAQETESEGRELILQSQRKAYDSCLRKLDNLLQLRISPLNSNGSLLSDEEYTSQRAELLTEKARLQEMLGDAQGRVERWLEIAERALTFACYARYWFADGTPEEKTRLLQAIGSNLVLKDKKLHVDIKKPFLLIRESLEKVSKAGGSFEPVQPGQNEAEPVPFHCESPMWRGRWDDVRTWIMNNLDSFDVPSFKKEYAKAA